MWASFTWAAFPWDLHFVNAVSSSEIMFVAICTYPSHACSLDAQTTRTSCCLSSRTSPETWEVVALVARGPIAVATLCRHKLPPCKVDSTPVSPSPNLYTLSRKSLKSLKFIQFFRNHEGNIDSTQHWSFTTNISPKSLNLSKRCTRLMKCISRKAFEIEVQTLKAQDGKALGLVLADGFHGFFLRCDFFKQLELAQGSQIRDLESNNFWYMDFE